MDVCPTCIAYALDVCPIVLLHLAKMRMHSNFVFAVDVAMVVDGLRRMLSSG